tara:strand:- start:2962 stop:3306 length:345 start_codon:yes stop_codon:yes gene_type:complete
MFNFFCLISAFAFMVYGLCCIFSGHMVVEFERYRLARFRMLTGYLQILGAIGLLVGFLFIPAAGLVAALGLSVQMLLGFGVRLLIRDSLLQCIPSFGFMLINAGLVLGFLNRLT